MDALLKGLQRRESLKGAAKQKNRCVPALVHGHLLQRLQRKVFLDAVRREQLLENYHLVTDLAETDQEVAVGRRGMDFEAQFIEGGFRGVEPFRGRECQQSRL